MTFAPGMTILGQVLAGHPIRGLDLHGSDFRYCNFRGSDLSGCNFSYSDLSHCDLSDCNLTGSYLHRCNLSYSDISDSTFRAAKFPLVAQAPVIPEIHKAVYRAASQKDALNVHRAHGPGPGTHSWAGWVVHLADGYELEAKLGTCVAAALIYLHSDTLLETIPQFYYPHDVVLKSMKELSEARQ